MTILRTPPACFLTLICLYVGAAVSVAQPAAAMADTLLGASLQEWARQLQAGSIAANGNVSLSVRRVSDGKQLVGFQAAMSLPSASTLKLITTATALAVLTPTYTYRTRLTYDGYIADSTLHGNVYISGSGDPSLGSWRFAGFDSADVILKKWSAAIRAVGIKAIQGRMVGDAAIYSDITLPSTWPFGDLGNYYGAALSGLNFNENLYRMTFRPGRQKGEKADWVRTDPALPYLTFYNQVTTDAAGTGDQVYILGAPFQRQQWLTGKVPMGHAFVVKGALPDPAFHAAFALHQQLVQDSVGISELPYSIGSGLQTPTATKRIAIAEYQSPMLKQLVRETNFQSLNLYAEALLRTTALTLNPNCATTDEAVEVLTAYWKAKGIDLQGFRIRDGSGLSTVGSLTADNMTNILTAMKATPVFSDFYASIPVVGQSGTVRLLARNTTAAGNVRAKSGSIEGVRAYAGYATAANGDLLSFCVLVNKFTPNQARMLSRAFEDLFKRMTQKVER